MAYAVGFVYNRTKLSTLPSRMVRKSDPRAARGLLFSVNTLNQSEELMPRHQIRIHNMIGTVASEFVNKNLLWGTTKIRATRTLCEFKKKRQRPRFVNWLLMVVRIIKDNAKVRALHYNSKIAFSGGAKRATFADLEIKTTCKIIICGLWGHGRVSKQ